MGMSPHKVQAHARRLKILIEGSKHQTWKNQRKMQSHPDSSSDQSRIVLKRKILSLKGLCIGLIAGLTAVGFRLSLEYAEKLRNTFLAF